MKKKQQIRQIRALELSSGGEPALVSWLQELTLVSQPLLKCKNLEKWEVRFVHLKKKETFFWVSWSEPGRSTVRTGTDGAARRGGQAVQM